MLLHIINKSPFTSKSLNDCLRVSKKGSSILFIEDAVYAVKEGTSIEPSISEISKDHPLYVLEEDLKARGIDKLKDSVQVINYEGFVNLVEKHNTCSWI